MANENIKQAPAVMRQNWGWLLGLGILFVILGFIGLGMLVGLTLVSVLFLGVLLIIAGILQIVDVFQSKHWRASLWHALIAVLYIIGGGIIIYDPFLASTVITALIASVLIVIGVVRLIMAFSVRPAKGWGWLIFAGLIAIFLGILILIQWPWSGLWVIGMFIAIDLMMSGWTYIALAVAMRRS